MKCNIFISYCHKDPTSYLEAVKSALDQLIVNKVVDFDYWYDEKIHAGEELQPLIDRQLNAANIIILVVTSQYLLSSACAAEMKKAVELSRNKQKKIVPIIFELCPWQDNENLRKYLAIPKDGKPYNSFSSPDEPRMHIYEQMKLIINEIHEYEEIKPKQGFIKRINRIEFFEKSHKNKENLQLNEIYVYPELKKYDEKVDFQETISLSKIIEEFNYDTKILYAGEDQSGKTTSCYKIFIELNNRGFIPIYLNLKEGKVKKSLSKLIELAWKEQYETTLDLDLIKSQLVLILDDFHYVENKGRIISELTEFPCHVMVVDNIYTLNIRNQESLKNYIRLEIKEFSPSKRHELITKWTEIYSDVQHFSNDNIRYQEIDELTELIDQTLGKFIGKGIMPSYPFFILSIIFISETSIEIESEITSQGHFYQALMYKHLRKQGVANIDIETYINFLTELSFYMYDNHKTELSGEQYQKYIDEYSDRYNLPVEVKTIKEKLIKAQILKITSLGSIVFSYLYIYYFFVARFLAKQKNNKHIERIINNLHFNENAYIALFISHHSQSDEILEEILLNAMLLFDKEGAATLSKKELASFDKEINLISKEVMPGHLSSAEGGRQNDLTIKDSREESEKRIKDSETDEIESVREFRRAIKTCEVMGLILKNRAGSLEKSRLIELFEQAMLLQLRLLNHFIMLVKKVNERNAFVKHIADKIDQSRDSHDDELPRSKIEELAKIIFWNLNYFVIRGMIEKIVKSIGSNKLSSLISQVCDRLDTPASMLIKHGVLMWYNKNLDLDVVTKRAEKADFSKIAKRLLNYQVVNYCSLHNVGYKDKQRIESKLHIKREYLNKNNPK